jgi:TM2 domain-containing membrane protein YozV
MTPTAPANTPNPVVVALVSFLLPGAGQMMNGQTAKGAVILVVSILTCYLGGLAGILFAVEAYMVATKRKEGKEVTPWGWF